MTRKTANSHMRDAVKSLQSALFIERRDLHLMLLLLLPEEKLCDHFDAKTIARLRRDFDENVRDGLPATIERFKALYPEMFYDTDALSAEAGVERFQLEKALS